MTISAETFRAAHQIDDDRQRIERAGVAISRRIAGQALRYARASARYGHDSTAAARAVLLGDDNSDHATVVDALAEAMVVANLSGRRRSFLNHRTKIKTANLSRSPADDAQKQLDEDERALVIFLFLDDDELGEIRSEYATIAHNLVEAAIGPLAERIDTSTSPAEVSQDFNAAGFARENAYAIKNIFSAGVVKAFEDGRRAAWQKPEIRETLWGFRFVAVLDDRTTPQCRSLSNTVAPKDDPFWNFATPPLHANCRSCLIEVYSSDALNEPDVVQPNATPEQIQQWVEEKKRWLSYF